MNTYASFPNCWCQKCCENKSVLHVASCLSDFLANVHEWADENGDIWINWINCWCRMSELPKMRHYSECKQAWSAFSETIWICIWERLSSTACCERWNVGCTQFWLRWILKTSCLLWILLGAQLPNSFCSRADFSKTSPAKLHMCSDRGYLHGHEIVDILSTGGMYPGAKMLSPSAAWLLTEPQKMLTQFAKNMQSCMGRCKHKLVLQSHTPQLWMLNSRCRTSCSTSHADTDLWRPLLQ